MCIRDRRILVPATLEDARGMLVSAMKEQDPVLIFEHVGLYNLEGELDDGAGAVDITRARVRREGRDLTILTYGASLGKSLEAAALLAKDGIDAEVVDLRVLRPLDDATIIGSVTRTHRVLVVDEGWKSGGLSAELIARINEAAFDELDAPPARLCTAEVPIPYPKHLEDAALPQVDTIVVAAKKVVGRG